MASSLSVLSGQVLLTAEQDRNELLPKACYLAHAVKDKDILRTHLEHAAMERYLSSERHLTLLPGCEVQAKAKAGHSFGNVPSAFTFVVVF